MIKAFYRTYYRSGALSFGLFITAILLYNLSIFIQEKTDFLSRDTLAHQHILKELKALKVPEKYIALLRIEPKISPINTLNTKVNNHYLTIDKTIPLPNNSFEINLKGDLDSDIFIALQEVLLQHAGTLSIKEIGVFRNQNSVLGKVIFQSFLPLNESGELANG